MQTAKEKLIGSAAAIFSLGGAIALAFFIALRTFWWCPEGGCSLAGAEAKLDFLVNVIGLLALLVVFNLTLLFVFVLLARPFVTRSTMERVLFSTKIRGLGWYDQLQHKWIAFLYQGSAA